MEIDPFDEFSRFHAIYKNGFSKSPYDKEIAQENVKSDEDCESIVLDFRLQPGAKIGSNQVNDVHSDEDDNSIKSEKLAKKRMISKQSIKESVSNFNNKIRKNVRILNPMEIKNGLQKSLNKPLSVRSRFERRDLCNSRQIVVENNSPSSLGDLQHPFDIPLPKIKWNHEQKSESGPVHIPSSLREVSTLAFNKLPNSLKDQNIVTNIRDDLTVEELTERQNIVRTMTPTELSKIDGIADIPIPSRIQNVFHSTKTAVDVPSSSFSDTLSNQWTRSCSAFSKSMAEPKLVTNIRETMADVDVVKLRQEITRSKTPAELAEISTIKDVPIPSGISKMISTIREKTTKNDASLRQSSEGHKSPSETLYESLPKSWREKNLVTGMKVENLTEDEVNSKQQLTRTKSPAELAKISSLADIPIPHRIEKFFGQVPQTAEAQSKSWSNLTTENIKMNIPSSLKTELLVRTRINEDPQIQLERSKLVSSKSVSDLSRINSFSDIPVPKIFHRCMSKAAQIFNEIHHDQKGTPHDFLNEVKNRFNEVVPNTKLLVQSKMTQIDPVSYQEDLMVRRSKSVSELSKINSVSDFPLPKKIDKLFRGVDELSKTSGVARRMRFRQKLRSHSIKSLPDAIYNNLPKSAKSELLVASVFEEPETQQIRREIVKSKSVSELARIETWSDFPIPQPIENALGYLKNNQGFLSDRNIWETINRSNKSLSEVFYENIPQSMTNQVLVRSRVESPEVMNNRRNLVGTRSVLELSQVRSLSDFPVPSSIEGLARKFKETVGTEASKNRNVNMNDYNIYDSLPQSLRTEVFVKSKFEPDNDHFRTRMEAARSKSPAILSQIHSVSELPLPDKLESWLAKSPQQRMQTGLDLMNSAEGLKEKIYKNVIPKSLISPCVVRSTVEEIKKLEERQVLQQTKSIHELSKIRNLNEFPLPMNLKFPDVPLPKTKNILKSFQTSSSPPFQAEPNKNDLSLNDHCSTPLTPDRPMTDDELLRYELSSTGELSYHEPDLDYAAIKETSSKFDGQSSNANSKKFNASSTQNLKCHGKEGASGNVFLDDGEDSEILSVAEMYRGTPERIRRKKKNKNRNSCEISSSNQSIEQANLLVPSRNNQPNCSSLSAHSSNEQIERIRQYQANTLNSCADSIASSGTLLLNQVVSLSSATWVAADQNEDATLADDSIIDSMLSLSITPIITDEDDASSSVLKAKVSMKIRENIADDDHPYPTVEFKHDLEEADDGPVAPERNHRRADFGHSTKFIAKE